ncbi:MAG TPA: ABC transporter permease [Anaerolineae bacterium]|nr:ABC transporter permease [Anaerolineae bacterium]
MTASRFLRQPSLLIGLAIVALFAAVALAAPLIAPPQGRSPDVIPRDGFSAQPLPPGDDHPFGTTQSQNDIFYGVIWGTRAAFRIGVLVTLGRLLIGGLVGLVAGYQGGWVDALLMRITDAFLAFPVIAAVMVMLAVFGNVIELLGSGDQMFMLRRVEIVITVALVLFGWMPYARMIRGNALSEREKEYMQAARASGVPGRRILFRHLLPNVTQGIFVLSASDVGAMVVLVSALNFIGFGAGTMGEMPAEWGQLLSVSRNWIVGAGGNAFRYWFTFVPVSLAVVLFAVGWNLIGDGLRDAFDPRTK